MLESGLVSIMLAVLLMIEMKQQVETLGQKESEYCKRMVQPFQKSGGSIRPERTIKPAGNPQATSSRGRKTKVRQHPVKLETTTSTSCLLW